MTIGEAQLWVEPVNIFHLTMRTLIASPTVAPGWLFEEASLHHHTLSVWLFLTVC